MSDAGCVILTNEFDSCVLHVDFSLTVSCLWELRPASTVLPWSCVVRHHAGKWLILEYFWLLVYILRVLFKGNSSIRLESKTQPRPSYRIYLKWPHLRRFSILFVSLISLTYLHVFFRLLSFVGFLLFWVLNTSVHSLQSKGWALERRKVCVCWTHECSYLLQPAERKCA